MKRNRLVSITVIVAAIFGMTLLASCSDSTDNDSQSIKKLVSDYSSRTLTAENASITAQELIVKNGGSSKSYKLPEDEFFVSIAPYVNHTHPCSYHSFTSCQGELVNEEFEVYIEDEDGNLVIDEVMKTQSNGFIDLWLPRDKTYQITFTKDGKSTQAEFSTFKNDYTCITTIQLI